MTMFTYAIIDSSQRVGFHKRLDKLGACYQSLFKGTPEGAFLDIAPLVIDCREDRDSAHGSIKAEIDRLAHERPAVSMVETSRSLKEIVDHFRRFHVVKLPRQGEMVLRWYDTRVLPAWMQALNTPQALAFAEGIDAWRMYDRFGDEVVLPLPEMSDDIVAVLPLKLDQSQYDHLLRASAPDVLIANLRQVIRDELRRVPERTLYPFVAEHLRGALDHGLDNLDDQTQYVLLALYTNGMFIDHPVVSARLQAKTEEREQTFEDWTATLPESVFNTGPPLWETVAGSSPVSSQAS